MRPTTLSSYRKRKSIKLFKDLYDSAPTDIEYVGLVGTDEPIFKISDEKYVIFALFYENTLTTYAISIDYFIEETNKEGTK